MDWKGKLTDKPPPDSHELFIRLDVAGLAALLKAVEEAMVDGRGHLTLGTESGIAITSRRSPEPFGEVIVKFAQPTDPGHAAPVRPTPAELIPA